jgi:hypothetical protein
MAARGQHFEEIRQVLTDDRILFNCHTRICRLESIGAKSNLEAKYNRSGYTEF